MLCRLARDRHFNDPKTRTHGPSEQGNLAAADHFLVGHPDEVVQEDKVGHAFVRRVRVDRVERRVHEEDQELGHQQHKYADNVECAAQVVRVNAQGHGVQGVGDVEPRWVLASVERDARAVVGVEDCLG